MRKIYWWIAGVIVVAVIVIVYAAAHGSSYNSNYPSPSASSSSPSASNSGAIVTTKSSAAVGQYLADGSGRTLYTYKQDKPGVSNVSGGLLAAWPAYAASNKPSSLPANVSTISRSDGTLQYAYKNMPLYYFAGEAAGQVTGNGVSDFFVAKP